MELAGGRMCCEHAGFDILEDGVEAVDLLLRREVVIPGLGGVGVKIFVCGHDYWLCRGERWIDGI